jgi:predicted DNA-binding transcriptional regulator AlpA
VDGEKLVGRLEAAQILGISPATLDRLTAAGELPSRRRLSPGRSGWLYSELVSHLRALPIRSSSERTAAATAARRARREAAGGGDAT